MACFPVIAYTFEGVFEETKKHSSDTLYIILSYRFVPLHVKVGLFEIVGLGTVAGIAATYSAMSDLIANKFTVPCYVNPSKA